MKKNIGKYLILAGLIVMGNIGIDLVHYWEGNDLLEVLARTVTMLSFWAFGTKAAKL